MKFLSFVVVFIYQCCFTRFCSSEGTTPKECIIPPSFWCDTAETAAVCGVTDQCKQYSEKVWNRKLKLSLIYESQCPDCRRFITDVIYPKVWANLRNIVDLEMLPYGNAKETAEGANSYKFICQHGETECHLNILHTCAIHILKESDLYMPLINCFEKNWNKKDFGVDGCFMDEGIPPNWYHDIIECQNGTLGNQLEHVVAEKTDNSWPAEHLYTPWLMLNDLSTKHLQTIQRNLPASLCNFYKGDHLPSACTSFLKFKEA